MYLTKLIIINYRSCRKIELELDKDTPAVLLGINDSGKSTIQSALRLLLDQKHAFAFSSADRLKSDISNSPLAPKEANAVLTTHNLPEFGFRDRQAAVVGLFKIEDGELDNQFDEGASTQLKWCLDNSDSVYLMRLFDETNGTATYYLALPESKEPECLWTATAKKLGERVKELGIAKDDIDNDNNSGRFTNLEQVRAIYSHLGTEIQWSPFDFSKKDPSFFPQFKYLDWNCSLKDLEDLATEAMHAQISSHKLALEDEAVKRSADANRDVNTAFSQLTQEALRGVPSITGIKSNVNFKVGIELTDIVLQKEYCDSDIHLESQGDGIKRQIWFALLRYRSLQSIGDGRSHKRHLWCFDEPETHLYPSAQREFFEVIQNLSGGPFQTLISTHSTIFIDRSTLTALNRVILEDKYTSIVKGAAVDDVYDALHLRNSDFLFFDKFIACEGPTEEALFPHFARILTGKSLLELGIQLINLGGKSNRVHNMTILERLFANFRKSSEGLHIFLDADSGVKGPNVYPIGTFDLEDSISDDVWINFVNGECGLEITKDELTTIRDGLRNTQHGKFYRKLDDLRRAKANEDGTVLPSKGSASGQALRKYITTFEDIPSDVREPLMTILESLLHPDTLPTNTNS